MSAPSNENDLKDDFKPTITQHNIPKSNVPKSEKNDSDFSNNSAYIIIKLDCIVKGCDFKPKKEKNELMHRKMEKHLFDKHGMGTNYCVVKECFEKNPKEVIPNNRAMGKHNQMHKNAKKPLKCARCDYVNKNCDVKALKEHFRSLHYTGIFQCANPGCVKEFQIVKDIDKHRINCGFSRSAALKKPETASNLEGAADSITSKFGKLEIKDEFDQIDHGDPQA